MILNEGRTTADPSASLRSAQDDSLCGGSNIVVNQTSHLQNNPGSAGALAEVKLGQLQIAGLRNLQINLRTVHNGYGNSGALD